MQRKWHKLDELIRKRQFKKAEAQLKRLARTVIQSAEDEIQLLTYKTRICLLTGRTDDALESINKIKDSGTEHIIEPAYIELEADILLARYEQAQVGFVNRNELAQAQKLYRVIVKSFPHYDNLGWIYYQLGRTCLLSGMVAPAENSFHHALLHPSRIQELTAFCYERLGFIAFFEAHRHQQAMTFLQKAIDTYPVQSSSQWLIEVYLLQSRVLRDILPEKALQIAQNACELAEKTENKPVIADALFAMAEIAHQHRLYPDKIIEYLQLYLRSTKEPTGISVTHARVYEMMADAYFEEHQYEQAVQAYEQILNFNPDYPWEEHIRYQIASSHYRNKAYEQVITTIQPIVSQPLSVADTPVNYHNFYSILGNAYFAIEDYQQASNAYSIALKTAPTGKDTRLLQASYDRSLQLRHE